MKKKEASNGGDDSAAPRPRKEQFIVILIFQWSIPFVHRAPMKYKLDLQRMLQFFFVICLYAR